MAKTRRGMWMIRAAVGVVCVVITSAFVPWDTTYALFEPLPATVAAEVGTAPKHGLDGMIVYVDKGGKAPEFYAAGWKDRQAKIPADPHALFKIASISKLYIAAATVKLVAAHRLSLDDTLAHLLPQYAGRIANADRITLRMLLRHRSGIPNYITSKGFEWDKTTDEGHVLGLVLDKPADFAPDASYAYSNTNYLLIGMILDKVLGYSHRDYIQTEIVKPLGLTHTYGLMRDAPADQIASGYAVGYDADMKPLDCAMPGGSMVASAEDVGVFLRALNTGKLLTPQEQAIYTSVYTYDHTGLWAGYESIARYHKDIDTVVVEFVSTSGGNAWMKADIEYGRIVKILHRR